jgi:riboflavin kinase/FMN adenylyltransferase
LGFPTANLEVAPGLVVPGDGVYATWASVEGDGRWKAATSIGVRPTFGGGQRTVEAFLIGFQGDLYGRRIRLEFTHRLRDELRFDSVEALVRQMHEDVRRAERLLEGAEAAD